MHNYYYHDPKLIDLAKLREDAQQRLDGKGPYRGAHEESIIHHHGRHQQAPTTTIAKTGSTLMIMPCEGHVHEEYKLAKSDG